MNAIVTLPEAFAARFGTAAERDRHVLEVLARDEYRAGRLDAAELQSLLGFATQEDLNAFLDQPPCDADDLAARFQAFAEAHSFGKPGVTDVIRAARDGRHPME